MSTLSDWWEGFWDTIQHSQTILPTHYAIPSNHTNKAAGEQFQRDHHYFIVKVNQIFLQYNRQFWTTYAPMALVVSEFDYNEQSTVLPFVVGPSLLEKDRIELPSGFIFSDTKVAGIHPYKGGGLKLTVILYRVKRTDLAKKLLKTIESIASVLDFSQSLAMYLKVAGVLVESVETVVGSDGDNQPIIGLRKEFDAFDGFAPGYSALIDTRKIKLDVEKLWVNNNELLYGDRMDTAQPFTDADYVLYSIGQSTNRDDYSKLAFYDQWKVALAESFTKSSEKWESALANWTALCQMMQLSPDLISSHGEILADECFDQMERNHEKITARSKMSANADDELPDDLELRGISERLDNIRSKSVAVLHND